MGIKIPTYLEGVSLKAVGFDAMLWLCLYLYFLCLYCSLPRTALVRRVAIYIEINKYPFKEFVSVIGNMKKRENEKEG